MQSGISEYEDSSDPGRSLLSTGTNTKCSPKGDTCRGTVYEKVEFGDKKNSSTLHAWAIGHASPSC